MSTAIRHLTASAAHGRRHEDTRTPNTPSDAMNLTLHVWRQKGPDAPGRMVTYQARDVSPDQSFLEMLDQLNEELITRGEEPVAFDHDCREGICGSCGMVINGVAHGPEQTTTCQLHMRSFKDGDDHLHRALAGRALPGHQGPDGRPLAPSTGSSPPAATSRSTPARPPRPTPSPIRKEDADAAFDAATCIGCGACVAACKNASAMLFTSAKVSQLAQLPQGQVERKRRVLNMVEQMDEEGFGNCSNYQECEAVCPKAISTQNIAVMNREYLRAGLAGA